MEQPKSTKKTQPSIKPKPTRPTTSKTTRPKSSPVLPHPTLKSTSNSRSRRAHPYKRQGGSASQGDDENSGAGKVIGKERGVGGRKKGLKAVVVRTGSVVKGGTNGNENGNGKTKKKEMVQQQDSSSYSSDAESIIFLAPRLTNPPPKPQPEPEPEAEVNEIPEPIDPVPAVKKTAKLTRPKMNLLKGVRRWKGVGGAGEGGGGEEGIGPSMSGSVAHLKKIPAVKAAVVKARVGKKEAVNKGKGKGKAKAVMEVPVDSDDDMMDEDMR